MKILKIRYVFTLLGMCLSSVASAAVQLNVGLGLPPASIGINVPAYPELVVVPGYPVYYAPRLPTNYFFYDGMYWVFQGGNWYASSWYNGPWWIVEPDAVPAYILRIPVRYYRQPPAYFRGWQSDAPPRWDSHWGRDWEQHRRGWDKWDRGSEPTPAPLPIYQRQYSGDRYPRQLEQQHELQQQRYRYRPRDPAVQQHYQQRNQERAAQGAPAQQGRSQQEKQGAPQERGSQRPSSAAPEQGRSEARDHRRAPQPTLDQREQQVPGSQERDVKRQDKSDTSEQKRGQTQGQARGQQERGRDRSE